MANFYHLVLFIVGIQFIISSHVIASNCEGGGIACTECETAISEGCIFTDVDLLLNGFVSCTPAYEGPEPQSNQPSPLCNGAGVPHNMSWFAFEANSTVSCIRIVPFMCSQDSGGIGLQSGIYDFCKSDGGECIAGEVFCSTGLDPIEYDVAGLIPGNIYYLFVDGCNGAECDYEIIIDQEPSCLVDTPKDILVESTCPAIDSFTYCDISELNLLVTHFGDSPYDWGIYNDENSIYSPDIFLNYTWKVTPPIIDFDTIFTIESTSGFIFPKLSKENTDTIQYQICLESIESSCDLKQCDDCCINISIKNCGNDYDQDGFNADVDCDDCDPMINPDAIEILDNEIDENCDGNIQTTSSTDHNISNFLVYPNPFQDNLYFLSEENENIHFELFDIQGKKLESFGNTNPINLSYLKSGIYFLKANFVRKKQSTFKKILKL